ncbi:Chromosome transmission fidelity protein 8 -like protein [Echinococcus granulosus]|uniref:Chromosome transmission fidelity protein n=1 Tax=Echinococcus granulosus TaxID=6210 RepID=W6U3R8_ECHGR|nr:Chromosome transmission fidelity protein [Echinococcus granulosus]EUB55748.1 Chromosome transmission fidelity protein [Echinococcus granulosus]KAH9281546.1 Chromosome transmission fidelity protein 8 -like protein [Echinococcus granulosus]
MIVRLRRSDTGVEEWGLIELQGELIDKIDGRLNGKVVGDLHFTLQNKPVFIIGHHILHGEVVELPKPFAVLRRVLDASGVEIVVTAVIRKKLLFRSRPEPIIWTQKS